MFGDDRSGRVGTGRLKLRPGSAATGDAPVGLQPLGLDPDRDGVVFVPTGYRPGEARPLVLMLHGAGGDGRAGVDPFLDRADEAGVILLGPDSRRGTWDALLGRWGPDLAFVERALDQTLVRYAVDAGQISVEGFSDGGSYALALGLANGDLFGRVIAFSPGYLPPSGARGRPDVFISHGIADTVLPVDRCSRRIVPMLRERDYEVVYREFDGGHEIPGPIRDEAFAWARNRG